LAIIEKQNENHLNRQEKQSLSLGAGPQQGARKKEVLWPRRKVCVGGVFRKKGDVLTPTKVGRPTKTLKAEHRTFNSPQRGT